MRSSKPLWRTIGVFSDMMWAKRERMTWLDKSSSCCCKSCWAEGWCCLGVAALLVVVVVALEEEAEVVEHDPGVNLIPREKRVLKSNPLSTRKAADEGWIVKEQVGSRVKLKLWAEYRWEEEEEEDISLFLLKAVKPRASSECFLTTSTSAK